MSIQNRQSPQELKKEQLSNDYASTMASYAAVKQQKRVTSDPVQTIQLQQQEKELFEKLEKIDTELKELEQESPDAKKRFSIFEQDIPLLDFNLAKDKFDDLLKRFDSDGRGGSAVFLIQKSVEMLGEVCLQGIQDEIRVKPEEDLKPYRLEFFPGVAWDEKEILKELGKQIGKFEEVIDIGRYTQEVQKTLIDSLRGYTTLFIELHGWDYLPIEQQKKLLCWFLDDFWPRLVTERERIAEAFDNVRCIVAIVVAGELEPDWCSLPYFKLDNAESDSDPANLQDERTVIELPLENWTQKDIEEWLKKCPKLTKKESEAIAERIQRITKGLPITACAQLKKELKNHYPIAS